jgi:two-component system sensor histidine kinase HydH
MKTPLVAIGGLASHLAKHPEKRQNSQEKLDLIVREATRLETMVRDMLDFGKELKIHPAPTKISLLVEETVHLADNMARNAGVEIKVETNEELGEWFVDGMKIRQLLLNLIENAIQACHPGSKVTVTTKSSQDFLVLEVSDEGCGVAVNDRDKIFDPFFTKKKTGTGLGLAMVKKIVDAHGGRIDVKDNVPRGTTITVSFPT